MTAAFAKELGLRVRFQVVESPEMWDRTGGLVFKIGHVQCVAGWPRIHPRSSQRMVELADGGGLHALPPVNRTGEPWAIGEGRVVGMYMNNRAAETLALGQAEAAYWWHVRRCSRRLACSSAKPSTRWASSTSAMAGRRGPRTPCVVPWHFSPTTCRRWATWPMCWHPWAHRRRPARFQRASSACSPMPPSPTWRKVSGLFARADSRRRATC